MSASAKVPDAAVRNAYTEELDAQRELDRRVHGLKVRIGKTRAAAQRADTLEQKIALYGRVKILEGERDLLYRNYWTEVDELVFGLDDNKIGGGG